tara:strand:- start:327 stop:944 length:618 start_codon:yes stop_codon:yes gene_type:complete
MNDSLYNFNDKSDIEDQSLKLNMDELFAKKQQQDLNLLNNYNKILVRIHNKIKYVSRQLINDQCCWYVMPEMMIGIPKYDYKDCTAYVIEKLRENGFVVRYTHPNLLFISWKQWVPGYVRSEIKKKTGNDVDEYGNIIDKTRTNNNDNDNDPLDKDNYNNLFTNNKTVKTAREKTNTDFKDIKSYNPSGNLIYGNNLLKKLDINA